MRLLLEFDSLTVFARVGCSEVSSVFNSADELGAAEFGEVGDFDSVTEGGQRVEPPMTPNAMRGWPASVTNPGLIV